MSTVANKSKKDCPSLSQVVPLTRQRFANRTQRYQSFDAFSLANMQNRDGDPNGIRTAVVFCGIIDIARFLFALLPSCCPIPH
jgi:hypothetical protein